MEKPLIRASKFLSLVLRHKPETIGLSLDESGWATIDDLVRLSSTSDHPLTRELIHNIVTCSDKQRFAIDASGKRIRANQGHSISVSLQLPQVEPPDVLFHGTAMRFLDSIITTGLHKGARHHVHLSSNVDTAREVGSRYGRPVILTIQALKLHKSGHAFYRAENGVWLTDHVPVEYIICQWDT